MTRKSYLPALIGALIAGVLGIYILATREGINGLILPPMVVFGGFIGWAFDTVTTKTKISTIPFKFNTWTTFLGTVGIISLIIGILLETQVGQPGDGAFAAGGIAVFLSVILSTNQEK